MNVYFAAPLFSDAEIRYNEYVCGLLEDAGHSTFLPQRDGYELVESVYENPGVETDADAMQAIFELDQSEVKGADIVTAILDGPSTDEGVAVELGIANGNDIPIIGLKTDERCFAEDEPLNAMVFGSLDELVETPEELVDTVNEYTER